jgi:phosphatidylinositol alpha-1,6-mannosyltransferase
MRAPDVDADRSPIIVTVSRLAELYKGHDVMMRAMPLVRARVAQARWIVIGDGPLRPFLAGLASAWGLGAAVEFTGRLPEGERDAWLNRAAVFAMPSRLPVGGGGEGFGIASLEAAARGVPAVAGSVGGAPDAVVDQQTGLLVDPVDHLEVADAVVRLLTDAQLARRMRREALVHAAHHRWETVGSRVKQLLSQLLEAGGA